MEENIKMAQEHALLGQYESAEVFFAASISDLSKALKEGVDSGICGSAKSAVSEEIAIVREIINTLSGFRRAPNKEAFNINNDEEGYISEPRPTKPTKPPISTNNNNNGNNGNNNNNNKLPSWTKPVTENPVKKPVISNNNNPINVVSKPKTPVIPTSNTRLKKPSVPKLSSQSKEKEKDNIDKVAEAIGAEKELVSLLHHDIIENSQSVHWSDIAELDDAKRLLEEAIVLPVLRPDYFQGIRRPWKGVLMFGPPGTGKTLLAKAVATEGGTTFFNVTAATLGSKYRGEAEKMVRILFEMARYYAPSTVFFDEVDALVNSRGNSGEHEASKRVKSELLIQMDGVTNTHSSSSSSSSSSPPMVMVLASTNFPWDVDEAMRRRLEKRIYIPLPGVSARLQLLSLNLRGIELSPDVNLDAISQLLDGYSGADITIICRDAAMMAMRKKIQGKSPAEIRNMTKQELESAVTSHDFETAIARVQPSVSKDDVKRHVAWATEFASF